MLTWPIRCHTRVSVAIVNLIVIAISEMSHPIRGARVRRDKQPGPFSFALSLTKGGEAQNKVRGKGQP